jgi:hypothetical protein
VIVKIRSRLGLPTRAPPHAPARVKSIYSKRSEEPKTACQRKPTEPFAQSSSERPVLQPRAHLRPPHRPDPGIQDPNKTATLTQLSLTGSARWRYIPAQKKGDLKFLFICGSRRGFCRAEIRAASDGRRDHRFLPPTLGQLQSPAPGGFRKRVAAAFLYKSLFLVSSVRS